MGRTSPGRGGRGAGTASRFCPQGRAQLDRRVGQQGQWGSWQQSSKVTPKKGSGSGHSKCCRAVGPWSYTLVQYLQA